MISRDNLKEYDKNGYFFIKGLFSIDELKPLINESDTFSSHPSKFSVKDAKGNPAHLISWTHLANDFIGVLPRLKKMVSIPEQILGKDISHWHSKKVLKIQVQKVDGTGIKILGIGIEKVA